MEKTELWSIKEKHIYSENNATLIPIGGVLVLATPHGEPLVVRRR